MLRKAKGARDLWETGGLSSTYKIYNPLTVKTKESCCGSPCPMRNQNSQGCSRKVSSLVSAVCDLQGHVHEALPHSRVTTSTPSRGWRAYDYHL